MLSYIWFIVLYQPLLNVLIWLYSNVAQQNLGWAVVWLTVLLRFVLLPFTLVSERAQTQQAKADTEAALAMKVYKNDSVAQKEELRRIMKKHKISPWAKTVVLLFQFLVLVLLYQVFIGGITGEKIARNLYPSIDFPGKINTVFYGFELGQTHNALWAGIAALYLLVSIYLEKKKGGWERSEVTFLILFPLFTFSVLWILPMVKSLFILTTMIVSTMINISYTFFSAPEEKS